MRRTVLPKLLRAAVINLFFITAAAAQTQIDIAGAAGSERFGDEVVALPNGNIVVADPLYDSPGAIQNVGAVYL